LTLTHKNIIYSSATSTRSRSSLAACGFHVNVGEYTNANTNSTNNMIRTRTRNTNIKTYVLLALLAVVNVTWLLAVMNHLHKSLPPDTRGFKTIKDAADVHADLLSNNRTINDINVINSATGKVFRGERIRTYDGAQSYNCGCPLLPRSDTSSRDCHRRAGVASRMLC